MALNSSAIQHVSKTATQPGFAGDVIVAAVNVLVEHVCVATAQAIDLLRESLASVREEVAVTAIP